MAEQNDGTQSHFTDSLVEPINSDSLRTITLQGDVWLNKYSISQNDRHSWLFSSVAPRYNNCLTLVKQLKHLGDSFVSPRCNEKKIAIYVINE